MNKIEQILASSDRAEAVELIKEELLKDNPKGIVIFVTDKENDDYEIHVRTFGLGPSYEAYGILEAANRLFMQTELENEIEIEDT